VHKSAVDIYHNDTFIYSTVTVQ